MNARHYERLGTRRVYAMTTALAAETMLPSPSDGAAAVPAAPVLQRTAELSRYYESNNWVRFVLLVPFLISFWRVHWGWHVAYVAALATMHLSSVVVERYKRALCRELAHRAEPHVPRDNGAPLPPMGRSWFYDPKRFETMRLYQLVGMELFRRFMEAWADCTRLTRDQRAQGAHATHLERPSRQDLDLFERATRTNEKMHDFGILLDLPLAVPYWLLGIWPLVVWAALIALFDLYCAVLQRYLRLRVWGLVQRLRSRA